MPDPHTLLNDAMNRRRMELGLQWRDLAAAAGISYEALRAIRRGSSKPADLTAHRLEEALQWEPGAVRSALSGQEPRLRPVEPTDSPPPPPGLSPSEALRHVISGSAQRLGLGVDDLDEVFRAVRQDLAPSGPPPQSRPRRPALSALVHEARLTAGLSVADVATRAASRSGTHRVTTEWLEHLEQNTLTPDEFPQYPELDALVDALHLDPNRVQEAAGAQFMDVHTVWSEDGQSRALISGDLSDEDIQKVQGLMRLYRRAPRQ